MVDLILDDVVVAGGLLGAAWLVLDLAASSGGEKKVSIARLQQQLTSADAALR